MIEIIENEMVKAKLLIPFPKLVRIMLDFIKGLFSGGEKPYQEMDSEAFEEALKGTKKAMLIDVRHRHEFDAEKMPNAINLDVMVPTFKEKIANYDPKKTFFVYCQSGRRSAKACKAMASLGFENLINLKGGLNQFEGKTIVK